MLGKGAIAMSFISVYIQGAEVFPTTVRHIVAKYVSNPLSAWVRYSGRVAILLK